MSRGNMKYILLSTIYLLFQPRITLLESKAQPTSQTFAICFLKSFLIRFLYIFVLWEISTGDAVMTKLFFQSLCHALSYVAALLI